MSTVSLLPWVIVVSLFLFSAAQIFTTRATICEATSASELFSAEAASPSGNCRSRVLAQAFVPDGGSDWRIIADLPEGTALPVGSTNFEVATGYRMVLSVDKTDS